MILWEDSHTHPISVLIVHMQRQINQDSLLFSTHRKLLGSIIMNNWKKLKITWTKIKIKNNLSKFSIVALIDIFILQCFDIPFKTINIIHYWTLKTIKIMIRKL